MPHILRSTTLPLRSATCKTVPSVLSISALATPGRSVGYAEDFVSDGDVFVTGGSAGKLLAGTPLLAVDVLEHEAMPEMTKQNNTNKAKFVIIFFINSSMD